MYDNVSDWHPTDETELVLLLGCGQADALERTAALCVPTGSVHPLVLAIGADGVQLPCDKLGHCCSVPTAQLTDAVRGILNVIAGLGYIHLNIADIMMTFEREGTFEIAIAGGKGDDRLTQAADGVRERLHGVQYSTLMLVLYYNPDDEAHPLRSNEIADMRALAKELDPAISYTSQVKWGIHYDKTLTDGEIRLVTVAN